MVSIHGTPTLPPAWSPICGENKDPGRLRGLRIVKLPFIGATKVLGGAQRTVYSQATIHRGHKDTRGGFRGLHIVKLPFIGATKIQKGGSEDCV